MKAVIILLAAVLALAYAGPTPDPKADPSLVYAAPAVVSPYAYSSAYYRPAVYGAAYSPAYGAAYNPVVYNYGYANAYPYGAYPYYYKYV